MSEAREPKPCEPIATESTTEPNQQQVRKHAKRARVFLSINLNGFQTVSSSPHSDLVTLAYPDPLILRTDVHGLPW